MKKTCAIILAAGSSVRMGEPKQLMELHGKPMILWVRDLALACVEQVLVITGHEAESVEKVVQHPRVKVVRNEFYGKGQGTSLQSGLQALPKECRAAIVMLGDQPFLPPPVIHRLLREGKKQQQNFPGAPFAMRPVYRGIPAHPVYFGHPQKLPEPTSDDHGGRKMLEKLPMMEYEVKEALVTFDIDTPEQWKKAGELVSRYDFSYNFRDTGGGSLAGTVNS